MIADREREGIDANARRVTRERAGTLDDEPRSIGADGIDSEDVVSLVACVEEDRTAFDPDVCDHSRIHAHAESPSETARRPAHLEPARNRLCAIATNPYVTRFELA